MKTRTCCSWFKEGEEVGRQLNHKRRLNRLMLITLRHNFPLETFREQKEPGTLPNYFKRADIDHNIYFCSQVGIIWLWSRTTTPTLRHLNVPKPFQCSKDLQSDPLPRSYLESQMNCYLNWIVSSDSWLHTFSSAIADTIRICYSLKGMIITQDTGLHADVGSNTVWGNVPYCRSL